MPGPVHVVLSFDPETMTGECAACGPAVPMRWKARGRNSDGEPVRRPGCSAGIRQHHRTGAGARARRHDSERGKHGLTRTEARALTAGKACQVCGTTADNGARLCVDHCHRRGRVRGILCDPCNRALGLLADDPARAEAAARYLRST